MKILYHHRTASKDGQAVHIEEMIAALSAQGHQVRVVAPAASDEGQMGGSVGWVHRLRVSLPRAAYELLELAYSLVAYRALARAAREFKPAVLSERYNLYLLAGVMLKRRRGISLLLEVNAPLLHEGSLHGGASNRALLARQLDIAECITVTGVIHLDHVPNWVASFDIALTRLCGDAALREWLERGARATIDKLKLTWDGNARRVVELSSALAAEARA